jgi:hypothetical protein
LPSLQVDEGRDRFRGHSCLVRSRRGSAFNIGATIRPWWCCAPSRLEPSLT